MGKLNGHWTSASTNDFLYRIGADFVQQLEEIMKNPETSQAALAKALAVTEGRVSQVLNSPGNLTLRKVIEYARALRKKVAIVVYDDNDPDNNSGPINSAVFSQCWERAGKPSDFFMLADADKFAANNSLAIERMGYVQVLTTSAKNTHFHLSCPDHQQQRNADNTSNLSTPEMRVYGRA